MTVFEASYIREKYSHGWPAYRIAARLNDMRDANLPILRMCDVVDHIELIDSLEGTDHGRGTERQPSAGDPCRSPVPSGKDGAGRI